MEKKLFKTYEVVGARAEDIIYPNRQSDKDAGYSLYTYDDFDLRAKGSKVVDTGIMLNDEIPGMIALVVGQGNGESLVRARVLSSSDKGKCIRVLLHNPHDFDIDFYKGDVVAQIIFMQCFFDESELADA